jgi:hypothetical protein
MRLGLSKGPNRVYVSLSSHTDRNRSSFRNVVFSTYLEFWTMDKITVILNDNLYTKILKPYFYSADRSGRAV